MVKESPQDEQLRREKEHQALLDVGISMARADGPKGVDLIEAANRVGLSPRVAYSHFADQEAFLRVVAGSAQSVLATMNEEAFSSVLQDLNPQDRVRAELRAGSLSYIRFALREPGLFRTMYAVPTDFRDARAQEKRGKSGRTPYQLLRDILDSMVETGLLAADRRPGTEVLILSVVHGLSMLLIDGPMLDVEEPRAMAVAERLMDVMEHGLPAVRPMPS